jgi:DNA mismatch repair protein MutS
MAGKSTLMRQVALIALLAQIGSFVPAESADLPIFDRIFTRIGASDFLSEGLSTFMVEMIETAEMLNQATGQSLVVLDEVGRGTSTYDGMSLAQAILEYLIVDTHATILFATHYHELTSLKKDFSQIKNAHMAIQERDGEISFLHTLREGPANKSYGIHVGRLAGLPQKVTRRAANILGELEKERYRSSAQMSLLPMDSSKDCASMEAVLALRTEDLEKLRREAFINAEGVHLRDEIKNVSLPDLTPLEALNRIAQWQKNLS